jgi:hypothetical protein
MIFLPIALVLSFIHPKITYTIISKPQGIDCVLYDTIIIDHTNDLSLRTGKDTIYIKHKHKK